MENPLVSVNMIAYNASTYIAESIHSIINQTYENWELIIVDDGSKDDTLSIASGFALNDSRIRVYTNGQNEGIVYTRNRAVHYSNGKYIAVLDSDDIALPERLEKQVAFMEANSDYGLVGSAFDLINLKGEITGVVEMNAPAIQFPIILLFGNFILHSSIITRTDLLKENLYRPLVRDFSPGEDPLLYVNIAKKHKIWNLPDKLCQYRLHSSSISVKRNDMIEFYQKKIILDQLSDLKIYPNDFKYQIHKKFKDRYFEYSRNEIFEVYLWINRIYKSNKKYSRFGNESLSYISGNWFQILNGLHFKIMDIVYIINSPYFYKFMTFNQKKHIIKKYIFNVFGKKWQVI